MVVDVVVVVVVVDVVVVEVVVVGVVPPPAPTVTLTLIESEPMIPLLSFTTRSMVWAPASWNRRVAFSPLAELLVVLPLTFHVNP